MRNTRNNYFVIFEPATVLGPSPNADHEYPRRIWKERQLKHFFFDDRSVQDCARAYAEALVARTRGKRIAVYRPTLRTGAWDEVPLVGHRDIAEIRLDITAKRVRGEDAVGSDKRKLPPIEFLSGEAAGVESAFKGRRRTLEEIRDDEYS